MAEPIELFTPRAADYGSYEQHLLEQYRLYVEMADRIAARRHTANTFFLTSNTAFVSFIALTWAKDTGLSLRIALVFVAVAGAALCWTWYLLVRAYRDLSTGKFAVIHKIEERLPLRLYEYEWQVLGEGKDPTKYRPFTHVEAVVPRILAGVYAVMAVILTALLFL